MDVIATQNGIENAFKEKLLELQRETKTLENVFRELTRES